MENGSLNQWLKCVFFALYAWNAGPVDGTLITRSVVSIDRDLPFTIDLSPERSKEGNSEVQQSLDHFEASYPLIFKQRELFNILISERRLIHREICNKGNLTKEFDTGDNVLVRKQFKSSRKYGISQKLLFKTKGS